MSKKLRSSGVSSNRRSGITGGDVHLRARDNGLPERVFDLLDRSFTAAAAATALQVALAEGERPPSRAAASTLGVLGENESEPLGLKRFRFRGD